MKNKLKEFKQYCEQQICKIQENYNLRKRQFNENDNVWVIDRYDNIDNGIVTESHYNANKCVYLYFVNNGYDIDTYVAGDDVFESKEDAEQILLYKSILRNTVQLLGLQK